MNKFELSPRLKMVADLVYEGRTLADIGTDHAYLPSYLILNGKTPGAIAADLRPGPLRNAQATIEQYGLQDRIKTILSDGLDEIKNGEAQEIVMAGMGGTLMTELLSRTDWIRSEKIHLVLQPQTHAEEVREFLLTNGFEILKEEATAEDERHYIAISAIYTGNTAKFTSGYIYIGELSDSHKKEALEYLNIQINFLKKKLNALENSGKFPEEVSKLTAVINEIKESVNNFTVLEVQ